MYVSGLFALLVALGVVPVVLAPAAGLDAGWAALAWAGLCLVLATVDVLSAGPLRAVEIERRIPARARRDEPVDTVILLRNAGRRRIRGRLRDGWQPTAGAGPARADIDLPAGERRAVALPLLPRRRGELRSAFVALRSRGPLGLAGRQRVVAAPGALRVLPPFTSRRHLPSRLARLRELDGNTSVQVRGRGTEFDSLREYVRGDDVRSIDWRATARAGTTMLRTWRPERDRHVVIVIDTGRTSASRVADGVRLDAAMESALLLSALAARAGDHVHLLMFDRARRARVTGIDGARLLPALVDAMAPVEPTLIDTDWSAVLTEVRALTSRPSLIVLLTAQDAPDAARGFLGALPPLTERATVLVGSATDDPERAPDMRTAEDVYRQAAVARASRDAELVASAIRRAGGAALTATPEALPPAIADHYLALKAAGRL
ncbi:DUF58 domain-containing protein [Microbacterium sp. cf332]|uniref:DUF58 domain-containing protein n=1 Tax=Microbacterium sp. cf332 TaxID=1761804 RepID=UPI00088D20F4|nr:DUF58 domain-containing protein [Microbacterium sp. cf332]SDQ80153.1 Uncharacterized conserved protein, DUF58 family, contains vWF domain [Microbacterium sp. cf332]